MVHASMLKFAQSGILGQLWLGMPRAKLQNLLGLAPDWSAGTARGRADIWRYGDLEFHFHDGRVSLVFSDHENLTEGGPTLKIDPWIICRGLSRIDFENHLRRLAISYTSHIPSYDITQRIVTTAAGARFGFVDQPEDNSDQSGLICWSINNNGTSPLTLNP
jgi:hypothetical protein